jgi:endo-1,4-beta-xylanase
MSNLREIAQEKGLLIGTCVNYDAWKGDEEYRELIAREFNLLTPENVLKWGLIRPDEEEFDFSKPDELIGFAEENGMSVTGHALAWHMQNPEWLENGDYSEAEMEDILKRHIRTVVGRYSDRIDAWDVVNEAVNDEGELRESIWLRDLGKEYIEIAFREAAKQTDADLFYNDYGLSYDEEKREKVYELLSDLLEKGVPVDGIGLQMHFIGVRAEPGQVRQTIKKFQELGLEVRMTEMDVAYDKDDAPEGLEQRQAEYYREVFETCLENGVESLTVWGARDSESWINVFQDYDEKYTDSPLLYDEEGRKKASYRKVKEALSEH